MAEGASQGGGGGVGEGEGTGGGGLSGAGVRGVDAMVPRAGGGCPPAPPQAGRGGGGRSSSSRWQTTAAAERAAGRQVRARPSLSLQAADRQVRARPVRAAAGRRGGGGHAATTAGGGVGTSGGVGRLLFFLFCKNVFAECSRATRQSLCRAQVSRYTAKPPLPADVCRVGFAVCYTRQRLCRVYLSLCRVPLVHGKAAVSCSGHFITARLLSFELWNVDGTVIPYTEPNCCPCGPNQRAPSSCGNFFDKMVKGKRNTAHCLRFPGDRFHVWGLGTGSQLRFSIRVQVKKGSSVSEVVVGPENRTVISSDNFIKVNLVGDFAGYKSIPSFESFYLVTPQKGGGSGQPQDLGDEHSKWMLLERVRFGPECNKIGVGYQAFQSQPNFCSAPLSSCLNEQLSNFWESDKNRIDRNQVPLYIVEGRYQRINQHPDAGAHSFSVGVTEALSSNVLLELSADDIEYFYQRSPGKIMGIDVATFEALSQVGTANVTTKNTGKLEASYRLAFNCLSGISKLEEQYYVMKPGEVIVRSFDLHTSTDQAEKYLCAAILKASDFTEVDRVECQFSTAATVFNNGTQIGPTDDHKKKGGFWAFLDDIKAFCLNFWDFVIDFLTGKSCSWTKCSSLFDISCHFQYICIGWVVLICLVIAMVPIGAVVLWLLHQKGLFDPAYDWWEDQLGVETYHPRHRKGHRHHHHHHHHRHSHRQGDYHHPHRHHHHAHNQRRMVEASHHHVLHRHGGREPEAAAVEGHRRHGHDAALGVQHRDRAGHKHRHGKAALSLDGTRWQRGRVDAMEFREWRPDEGRHAEHGLQGRDRSHSRF